MHPYRQLTSDFAALSRRGAALPWGGFAPLPRPTLAPDAPKALIFSPHPDDECVIGALALRLMREAGFRVVNVAVTQGSKRERQAGRLAELKNACAFLGFDLVQTAPNGLEEVNLDARAQDTAGWSDKVKIIAGILAEHRPRVVFYPHEQDWNSTHVGVHWLLDDALVSLGPDFTCYTVETEFWGQCDDPNLLVASTETDVADLIAGISFHVGEVKRNPYHVLLPAWMMDNVRRGAELVGGQGGGAPDFTFATLYRVRQWKGGRSEPFYQGGRTLAPTENAGGFFT